MTVRLTGACRATLRHGLLRGSPLDASSGDEPSAIERHADVCAFCAEWLRGRRRLQVALATPVSPPSELQAAAMLDGVRERLIVDCESGPVGELLASTLAPEALDKASSELRAPELEPAFAARLRDVPGRAPEWAEVRESVMSSAESAGGEPAASEVSKAPVAQSASPRAASRAVGFRFLAAAGVAAAAVAALNLLAERDVKPAPMIRFTDVPSLAGLDYSPMAVLRRGGE